MSCVVPIPFAGVDTLSLRQLDELNNLPKGSSFRWFKACTGLVEGRDYHYLPAEQYGGLIEQLKQANQVYASTRHLLLLTHSGYQHMRSRSRE